MKKRMVVMMVIVSLLCGACNTVPENTESSMVSQYGEVSSENLTQTETREAHGVTVESEIEENNPSVEDSSEQKYYEIQLEADELNKEALAEAVFGTSEYEMEQLGSYLRYFLGDAVIGFLTDTYFTYGKEPHDIRYCALVASSWGAVMLQDMRLESLFPENELSNGSRKEAEQVCDRIMEAAGYKYTEKCVYAIDPEFGNLMDVPSPSLADSWEADDGAYLLVYRNGDIVDVNEEIAFIDVTSVCHMIYSPKYGLCYINMGPVFHEVSRQEVEVITEEEAKAQTVSLFQMYGIPYDLVEVTGYELVYCENTYSMDDLATTSSVVPCWKISFRPKESDAALWQEDWSVARGTSTSEGYLILDARVGGDITSFYPTPAF